MLTWRKHSSLSHPTHLAGEPAIAHPIAADWIAELPFVPILEGGSRDGEQRLYAAAIERAARLGARASETAADHRQ